MTPQFERNGLIFWTEQEIQIRETCKNFFATRMKELLRNTNPAWQVIQIEAPLLTPRQFVNPNYGDEDMYVVDDMVLRPETTPGSYVAARSCLDDTNSGVKTPFCIWQAGKSFRKEQDQPLTHMRLKEFYQQEFQCIFTEDTANDYYSVLLPHIVVMINEMILLPTRLVPSDRLPSYSKKTYDVEVSSEEGKWMEVASISLRTDFPGKARFTGKNGVVEKGLLVVEVAIGLDRCVSNYMQRANAHATALMGHAIEVLRITS